jgi:hypothetical protein
LSVMCNIFTCACVIYNKVIDHQIDAVAPTACMLLNSLYIMGATTLSITTLILAVLSLMTLSKVIKNGQLSDAVNPLCSVS